MTNYPQQNYYQQPPPQYSNNREGELSGLPSSGKTICTIGIIALWMIALPLPAYSDGTHGATCLFFGWSMLFTNWLAFLSWIGNLPFIIGYCMFAFSKRKSMHRTSLVLGAVAFLFSFGALTVTEIQGDELSHMESVDPYIGAFVWMMSSCLLLIASAVSVSRPSVIEKKFVQNFQMPMQQQYQNYYQQYPQNYPQQFQQQPTQFQPTQNLGFGGIPETYKTEEQNNSNKNGERPDPYAQHSPDEK